MKKFFALFLLSFLLPCANSSAVEKDDALSNAQLQQIFKAASQTKFNTDGSPYSGTLRQRFNLGFITIPYVDGFVNGKIVVEFDDGGKIFNDIKDGRDHGAFRYYYPNGKLKVECDYLNDRCTSPERTYFEDGKLKMQKDCADGSFTGFLRTYYDNGQIEDEWQIVDEIPNGSAKHYTKEGALASEVFYMDGKMQGLAKEYYPSGALYAEFVFVDGKENGPVKIYYENGQLYKDFAMKDGVPEGKVVEYYENGRVFTTAVFKNKTTEDIELYYDEMPPKTLYALAAIVAFVLAFGVTMLLLYRHKDKQ